MTSWRMSRQLESILLALLLLLLPGQAFSGTGEADREFQIITLDQESRFLSVVERLSEGDDFAELARRYSQHHTSKAGGYWKIPVEEGFLVELLKRFDEASEGSILYFPHPRFNYVIVRKIDPREKQQVAAQRYLEEANQELNENRLEEAIELFKKALALDPSSGEAHMLLGYGYMRLVDYNMIGEAKAEFQQALSANPRLIWARYYLAKIYIDLGRLEDAERQLVLMLDGNTDIPHALALLGEVKRQLGEPEFSVTQNIRALELEPDLTAGHYYLGLAYLDLNRETEALRQLELAAASPGAISEVHVSLGKLYGQQERFSEALESLKRAIRIQPNQADAHLELARIHRLQGHLDLAEEELARTLPEDQATPMSPYFQRIRSELYFETGMIQEQKKELSAALESYLKVLAIRSDHGPTHRQLAGLFLSRGEIEKAREHALRAEELGSPVDASLLRQISRKSDDESSNRDSNR